MNHHKITQEPSCKIELTNHHFAISFTQIFDLNQQNTKARCYLLKESNSATIKISL